MNDGFIIDPSALIQGYVNEPFSGHMLALLEQIPGVIELHIPEFCLVECTNILWKYVRRQEMSPETARRAAENLSDLVLTIHPASSYLSVAFSIGLEHGLAIYDAIDIALAQQLQLPLITVDNKQGQIAEAVGVTLKPLTDFAPTTQES
jgi:predicted nucleic acid-binding protein